MTAENTKLVRIATTAAYSTLATDLTAADRSRLATLIAADLCQFGLIAAGDVGRAAATAAGLLTQLGEDALAARCEPVEAA